MIILPSINSFVRFLHVSPGSPSIDICLDGEILERDLDYNIISQYYPVTPGDRHIQLIPSEDESTPLADTEISIPTSEKVTVAVVGTFSDVTLPPISFNADSIGESEVLVRFAHLSPNTPPVDVKLVDGEKIFSNVAYTQVTDFISITPGAYHIKLKLTDGEETLFTSAILELVTGKAYTVYAVGLLGENPPLDLSYYQDQVPHSSKSLDKDVTNDTDDDVSDDSIVDNLDVSNNGDTDNTVNSNDINNGAGNNADDNMDEAIDNDETNSDDNDDSSTNSNNNDVNTDNDTTGSRSENATNTDKDKQSWVKEKIVSPHNNSAPKIIFTYG